MGLRGGVQLEWYKRVVPAGVGTKSLAVASKPTLCLPTMSTCCSAHPILRIVGLVFPVGHLVFLLLLRVSLIVLNVLVHC